MGATGFQILFLYFAALFGAMLASRWLCGAMALPDAHFEPISQAVTFILAGAVLVVVAPMRRAAIAFLSVPVPKPQWREVTLVTMLKLALPFGIFGSLALYGIATGNADVAIRRSVASDPAKEWAIAMLPAMFAYNVVFAWLIGPLLEEIYFRGFLYRAWERQWGWVPATLLTSLAFGAAHPGKVTLTFMGSLVYIALLRRTGSLRACIYAHCTYNVLVSWPLLGHLMLARRDGDPLAWSTWWLEIACLFAAAGLVPRYLFLARKPLVAAS